MKCTVQTNKGNVTGTRKPHKTPSGVIPRNEPYPRVVRQLMKAMRATKVNTPKWAVMSPQLEWMFHRAGLYMKPEGAEA
jgi:hypothetical protein